MEQASAPLPQHPSCNDKLLYSSAADRIHTANEVPVPALE